MGLSVLVHVLRAGFYDYLINLLFNFLQKMHNIHLGYLVWIKSFFSLSSN